MYLEIFTEYEKIGSLIFDLLACLKQCGGSRGIEESFWSLFFVQKAHESQKLATLTGRAA